MAIVLLSLLLISSVWGALQPKQLAGPPEEFANHKIPSPQSAAIEDNSAFYPVTLSGSGAHLDEAPYSWEESLYVDSSKLFRFGVFSPFEDSLKLELKDPNGNVVSLDGHGTASAWPISSDAHLSVEGTVFSFDNPTIGKWNLQITSNEKLIPRTQNAPHAAVVLWTDSPITILSHLSTYQLLLGNKIGLVANLYDASLQDDAPPLKDTVTVAEMEVVTPSGKSIEVDMHDDGLHNDMFANDGIYGGEIVADEEGDYELQSFFTGKAQDGSLFTRSAQHMVPVVASDFVLNDVATAKMDHKKHKLMINLELTGTSDASKFRPYAEVWAQDKDGKDVAVCWLSTITPVQTINGAQVLPLEMDFKWMARAGAKFPFFLKNVYVQDIDSNIPVATKDLISVSINAMVGVKLQSVISMMGNVTEITEEMRMGQRPPMPTKAKSGLVLLHGYCADKNQWGTTKDFTDGYYFLQANANVNNDNFANSVAAFAESHGLTSFGMVGHSQGGMAQLHLHNYYWSGLEAANKEGKRLLQSVGTPYQGNSGAGTASNLIKIFGLSCGANTDLTRDGAKLWLSGITAEAKKDVFYYTTTYEQGNFFGDWCNFAVNLVLQWPNDGVAEFAYAQLSGANNLGNKEKWCHSPGMTYPAQCTDSSRNAVINAAAAR